MAMFANPIFAVDTSLRTHNFHTVSRVPLFTHEKSKPVNYQLLTSMKFESIDRLRPQYRACHL